MISVYADKTRAAIDDEFNNIITIRPPFHGFLHRKRILVVDDVLTTGGSVKKVVEATRAIGGDVIGLGALVNRGGVTAAAIGLGTGRLEALVNLPLDSWDEEECSRIGPCSRGVPINTDVGKGREFLERRKRDGS